MDPITLALAIIGLLLFVKSESETKTANTLQDEATNWHDPRMVESAQHMGNGCLYGLLAVIVFIVIIVLL